MSTSIGRRHEASSFGLGVSIFAGATLAIAGVTQLLTGLVAIIDGRTFLVTTTHYAFELNATAWGWIHLIVGLLSAVTGIAIFTGNVRGPLGRHRAVLPVDGHQLPLAALLPALGDRRDRHRHRRDLGPGVHFTGRGLSQR